LFGAGIGRPIPLRSPVVTLMPTFKGLPMAITGSRQRRLSRLK